jgi:hypothetical protein
MRLLYLGKPPSSPPRTRRGIPRDDVILRAVKYLMQIYLWIRKRFIFYFIFYFFYTINTVVQTCKCVSLNVYIYTV